MKIADLFDVHIVAGDAFDHDMATPQLTFFDIDFNTVTFLFMLCLQQGYSCTISPAEGGD